MQELLKKTTHTLNSLPCVRRCKGTVWCDTSLCPGRWSFLMMLLGITVLANVGYAAPIRSQRQTDKDMATYVHNGNICYKCGRGTFVVKHCTSNFTYSDCDPCPVDHYQSHLTRAERCGRCRPYCPDDQMVVLQNCSATHDLECECKSGYYRHVDKDHQFMNHRVCKKHTICQFGQVIVKHGTPSLDTECVYCPDGHFFNSYSQCETCTSCSDRNVTQLAPCNATADALCQGSYTTGTPIVATSETPPQSNESDDMWLIITGIGLSLLIVLVVVVLCYCRRCREERDTKSIELTELKPSKPMLARSLSSTSASSSTAPKRQRTLSSSSDTSTVSGTVSEFRQLHDLAVWKHAVFDLLGKRLNSNWPRFMRLLPGDRTYKSDIDHRCQQIALEEARDIREQIHKALKEWAEAHDDSYVKVDSILRTLSGMEDPDSDSIHEEVHRLCCKLVREQKKRLVSKEQSISEM